ncbi:MAG: outer membrane protein assembly factor BamD [bacterium]
MRTGLTRAAVLAAGLLMSGCAGSGVPVDATPEEMLAHAQAKLDRGKFYDAAETLEFFLRTYPGNAGTPIAKLRLGDAKFGLGEYVLASSYFTDVVEDFPASAWVEEARFKIAKCAFESSHPYNRDQTETQRALTLFDDFRRDFPESRFLGEVEEARSECRDRLAHREFDAGRFYEKQDRRRSAYIQYQYVLDTYPDTVWAAPACLRIGEILKERGEDERAEPYLRRVLRDWPGSDEATAARETLDALTVAGLDRNGGDS